jgi:hypothetical protein
MPHFVQVVADIVMAQELPIVRTAVRGPAYMAHDAAHSTAVVNRRSWYPRCP